MKTRRVTKISAPLTRSVPVRCRQDQASKSENHNLILGHRAIFHQLRLNPSFWTLVLNLVIVFSNYKLISSWKSLTLIKRGQEKMFPIYTKTFAGKFGKICTAFPLATFSAKHTKWLSFTISRQNSFKHHLVQKS